jgi:hypothetical protein
LPEDLINRFIQNAKDVRMSVPFGADERALLAAAWILPEAYEKFKRYPEVLQCDTTFKTNCLKKPLLNLAGVDGEGRTFTAAQAFLLNERESSFTWFFNTSLPFLLGDTLKATSIFLCDESSAEINAFNVARRNGIFHNACVMRICLFHKVFQPFARPDTFGRHAEETNIYNEILKKLSFVGKYCDTSLRLRQMFADIRTLAADNLSEARQTKLFAFLEKA